MESKHICPHCGSELEARIHEQLIAPYHVYRVWSCLGRCRTDCCRDEGIRPEQLPHGIPKLRQFVGSGKEPERQLRPKHVFA